MFPIVVCNPRSCETQKFTALCAKETQFFPFYHLVDRSLQTHAQQLEPIAPNSKSYKFNKSHISQKPHKSNKSYTSHKSHKSNTYHKSHKCNTSHKSHTSQKSHKFQTIVKISQISHYNCLFVKFRIWCNWLRRSSEPLFSTKF